MNVVIGPKHIPFRFEKMRLAGLLATSNMNRARLLQLGYELGARAPSGLSQGAWFATAPDGTPVVLMWCPGETMADRYAVLLPGLDELRARGVPVCQYLHAIAVDDGTLSTQQLLPGRSEDNPSRLALRLAFPGKADE